jgi:hypothetical protein
MQCPNCKQAILITTKLVIKHKPDNSWDVKTPFKFSYSDPVECSSCEWSGTYSDLSDSTGMAVRNRNIQEANLPILEHATPYPWGLDDRGNLTGANGHALFFMGADAVLVRHSPVMLEQLLCIRKEATLDSREPGDRLHSIWRLDNLISDIERAYASQVTHPIR